MADTVHQAKFDRLFEIFDVTGDGYISQEDFDSVIEQVIAAPHGSPNGKRVQALRDGCARFWAGIKEHAEVDSAGRVGRDSFRTALDSAFLQGSRFDEIVRPAVEAWFALYDADGDGRVSHHEYELLQRTIGRPAADIDAGFRIIDANADGQLTSDEFNTVVHEYFISDDPNAPGNWLFGPL